MYKWYISIFGKRGGRERFNFLSNYIKNNYNDFLKRKIRSKNTMTTLNQEYHNQEREN